MLASRVYSILLCSAFFVCLFFGFVSQINLGISDFRMLMMVINDNLLEGRGGEF